MSSGRSSLLKPVVHKLTDYDNPKSLGSRLRSRRAAMLITMVQNQQNRTGNASILDIGGTVAYWRPLLPIFLASGRCQIHVVNLLKPTESHDAIETSVADGRRLPFDDQSFDIAHSNSVIEHVGQWRDMAAFAGEVRRVAASYFVQTPNFAFPIEPHYGLPFIHWLAPQVRASLLQCRPLGRFDQAPQAGDAAMAVQDSHLLTRSQVTAWFPDATIKSERFAGLAKSFIAVRHAA